jgi:predicted Rossmann fold flavoprotein
MAAIAAAKARASVLVIERNDTAGRKLLLTGGGRCNLTHAAGPDELVRTFGAKGRFLRHALHECPPDAVTRFFAERGITTITEPDGCVFPATGGARDIRDALVQEAERLGARLIFAQPVKRIMQSERHFAIQTRSERIVAGRVILATGGTSWPATGSTGDGYRFAEELGHTVVPPRPALVPLVTQERWVGQLAGVALSNVTLRATSDGRKITAGGALVFTQDGIGGPATQDLSRSLADALPAELPGIVVRVDLVPDTDESELAHHLQSSIAAHAKRTIATVLAEFVPRRLASALCALADTDAAMRCGQLSKSRRRRLVALMKSLPLNITSTRPIDEATVTRGGVSLDQIDPRTMQSKICPGLFFAGEVIDVDGPCGGYNLQIAWSTGSRAGVSISRSLHHEAHPPTDSG